MAADREFQLLERIANLLRSEVRAAASALGLQPVQLEIVEYLDRCNRYSDTPAALAEYLGLTKGTVSQSIARLEEKSFLRKRPDKEDGRVTRLALSAKGRKLAARRRGQRWSGALDALRAESASRELSLADGLEKLLLSLQAANGFRTFGACHTCRMFEHAGSGSFRCGLTGQPLSRPESHLICLEHEPIDAVSDAT